MLVSVGRIGASRSTVLGLSRSLGLSSRLRPVSRTPGTAAPASRGPCVALHDPRGFNCGLYGRPRGAAVPGRFYSRNAGQQDDHGDEETGRPAKKADQKRMKFLVISSPGAWLKKTIMLFIVRNFIDPDFTIEDFTDGAKQAFSCVSLLLAENKFDQLKGLMDDDTLEELRNKCGMMSETHRRQLGVRLENVMVSATDDVAIYANSGRHYVNILMRFWYMTSASLPDGDIAGMKIITFSAEDEDTTKRVATASYEFRREFTPGVDADWTITRLVHWKILE